MAFTVFIKEEMLKLFSVCFLFIYLFSFFFFFLCLPIRYDFCAINKYIPFAGEQVLRVHYSVAQFFITT